MVNIFFFDILPSDKVKVFYCKFKESHVNNPRANYRIEKMACGSMKTTRLYISVFLCWIRACIRRTNTRIHTCEYVYVHKLLYVCMHIYIYIYIYILTCIYDNTRLWSLITLRLCIHRCMSLHMYVYRRFFPIFLITIHSLVCTLRYDLRASKHVCARACMCVSSLIWWHFSLFSIKQSVW